MNVAWMFLGMLIASVVVALGRRRVVVRDNDTTTASSGVQVSVRFEKKKLRQWEVPDAYAEALWDLWTKWEHDDSRTARYKFWNKIEELFPETKTVKVHLWVDHATSVIIREGDSSDWQDGD
jgi:hypothetical protein